MKYIARTAGEWRQCPGYAKKILLTEQDLNATGTLTQLIEIVPHTSVAKHYQSALYGSSDLEIYLNSDS